MQINKEKKIGVRSESSEIDLKIIGKRSENDAEKIRLVCHGGGVAEIVMSGGCHS